MTGDLTNMAELLIGIELTPKEARAFRFMMESGVFDIKKGNAVLSFNENGELKSIKRELFTTCNIE